MLVVRRPEVQEFLDLAVALRLAVDEHDVAGVARPHEQEVDVVLVVLRDVVDAAAPSLSAASLTRTLSFRWVAGSVERLDALRDLAVALVVPVSRVLLVAQAVQHVQRAHGQRRRSARRESRLQGGDAALASCAVSLLP